jgi:DNA topoisomerase VI subunit B
MATTTLSRQTFETSRLAEFFTEKELRQQIGYGPEAWPLALLKELVDNALDACETAGVPPEITADLEDDVLTVADNGPGIPAEVVERSLDYLVRVSDKAHYVSPTRGQLGNALKTVWAAPYVAGVDGWVEVAADGRRHRISVGFDRIAQQPRIDHQVTDEATAGTTVRLCWPGIASYLRENTPAGFYNGSGLMAAYAAFNPHATFGAFQRSTGKWSKWSPTDPTSPHWYDDDALRSLVAAYLHHERSNGNRARTVREFVVEFKGLSGTAKQKAVTTAAGLSGKSLVDLVVGEDLDDARLALLLGAMTTESRPVKPKALGMIGADHIKAHLVGHFDLDPDSFRYRKVEGVDSRGSRQLPYVWEVAFGTYRNPEATNRRLMVLTGLNWTPTLRPPITQLTQMLGMQRVGRDDPVAIVVHLACPVLPFIDRGKSVVELMGGQ